MSALSAEAICPASLPARLVEVLPGIRRTTLATVICGEIATRCDCPSSYLRVLHALISHAGWHSNRVWASQARLAQLASAVRGICVKTVQRAIHFFVRTIGLRILSDPAERLRGPGEHLALASGRQKQGDYAVNHYDLSALRRFIPTDLAVGERPSPRFANPVADIDFLDPFAEPIAESSLSSETRHPLPCPVAGEKKEEGRPEDPRSAAPRPQGFERTKLSSVIKRYTPEFAATENADSPGARALTGIGVSGVMRRTILQAMGETWACHAALYARLQQQRGEIRTTPAAYLVAVYRTWVAERASGSAPGWPDWLEARAEREKAASDRVVRAESPHREAARRVVRCPLPPSPVAAAPPDPLTALPDAERERLTGLARAELRRSLPGAPAALIERLIPGRLARLLQTAGKENPELSDTDASESSGPSN